MKKRKIKKFKRKKNKIFIIFLFLFIAIILIINYTFFNKENVSNIHKSGYKPPCDSKFGGIFVGDLCYDCGVSDNICPEDYGTVCKIKDPDCS